MMSDIFLILLPCGDMIVRNGMEYITKNFGLGYVQKPSQLEINVGATTHIMNRAGIPDIIPKSITNGIVEIGWDNFWHLCR